MSKGTWNGGVSGVELVKGDAMTLLLVDAFTHEALTGTKSKMETLEYMTNGALKAHSTITRSDAVAKMPSQHTTWYHL